MSCTAAASRPLQKNEDDGVREETINTGVTCGSTKKKKKKNSQRSVTEDVKTTTCQRGNEETGTMSQRLMMSQWNKG